MIKRGSEWDAIGMREFKSTAVPIEIAMLHCKCVVRRSTIKFKREVNLRSKTICNESTNKLAWCIYTIVIRSCFLCDETYIRYKKTRV